jgi:hypothetical protein
MIVCQGVEASRKIQMLRPIYSPLSDLATINRAPKGCERKWSIIFVSTKRLLHGWKRDVAGGFGTSLHRDNVDKRQEVKRPDNNNPLCYLSGDSATDKPGPERLMFPL